MIAPALTTSVAEQWLAAKRSGTSPPGTLYEIGGPPRGDLDRRIESLDEELLAIAEVVEGEDLPPRARPGAFDSRSSVLIHRRLADLPTQIAADRDFWRYLACGPLYEVVEKRHEGSSSTNTFGLGKRWECLPERLWFRAHVSVASVSPDPYELTRRGTVDFWMSGPIKHLFGCSHSLVRALVRFQFPQEGRFTSRGGYRPQTLKFDGLRELYTRLNHFHATLELEALGDEDSLNLIEELAADLPRETD